VSIVESLAIFMAPGLSTMQGVASAERLKESSSQERTSFSKVASSCSVFELSVFMLLVLLFTTPSPLVSVIVEFSFKGPF